MAIKFLETDALTVYNTIINSLADNVGEPLYPGDERRIFGEALAMILMLVYNDLNDAGKQKALRYAKGEVLDALGDRVGVTRIEPTAASDIFHFSLESVQGNNIIIPMGTRITNDGIIYFATDTAVTISKGNLYADVKATCLETGEEYNNIAAGEIDTLVDLVPYVASVENLNGTSGGDDGEAYDDDGDDKLRGRIRLANAAFSVAGPEEAYKFYALSADAGIIDAYVDSPSANIIDIYPLMAGGDLPDDSVIQAVADVFTDDIKPMTDSVTIKKPMQVTYDINIKYYCTKENEQGAVNLVEREGGSIDSYIEWQCGALGRDITPDALRRRILESTDQGIIVERLDVIAPTFKELSGDKVAKFSGDITVTHEVITSA